MNLQQITRETSKCNTHPFYTLKKNNFEIKNILQRNTNNVSLATPVTNYNILILLATVILFINKQMLKIF